MAKIFFYTFRTNKFVGELEGVLGQNIFVVDRPAKDFAKLKSAIEKSGADYVVGIGLAKGKTRWERFCYNKIGKSEVSSGAPGRLSLVCLSSKIPVFAGMTHVGEGMTFGFCNYVAFRVAYGLNEVESSFLHLSSKDIVKLQALAV